MGPEQQPELGPTPQQQRQPEPEPEPEPRAEQAQAQGSEADAAEDGGSCKQRAVDGVEEYRRQLTTVLPIWWKVIWLVVLLLWVPIAYTVAAPVPGSMFLFLVAWTSTVMRCSGADAQQQQNLSADLLSDIEQEGAGATPESAVESLENPLAGSGGSQSRLESFYVWVAAQ